METLSTRALGLPTEVPLRPVREVVDELTAAGAVPSASVAVRVRGEEVLRHAAGLARLDPPRPADPDLPYDLASLTKPLAGARAAAALVERGALVLDEPAGEGLDPRITVRMLLDHVAGFPAWAPLHERVPRSAWGTASARRAIVDAALGTPLATEPGAVRCYSDLGFLALLAVLEARGGPLERQVGGADLRWGWPGAAATEDRPDRGGVVEGAVHDPIAFAMGGVSAHAGLFGTARAVAEAAEAVLDGDGEDRGAGWDPACAFAGPAWPADTVGHLGYTGTSIAVARRERVVVALLTNRVHPRDDDRETIRMVRRRVHDAVAQALGWAR